MMYPTPVQPCAVIAFSWKVTSLPAMIAARISAPASPLRLSFGSAVARLSALIV